MSPINLFETRAVLRVIGVGGAGGNTVNRLADLHPEGISLIALNTDRQALTKSAADHPEVIGENLTRGLGAGGDPEVGERSALESEKAIKLMLDGADMIFLTCGLGGGTGTGAAPVIAKIARQMGILTVAIVTTPFGFEGPKRGKFAAQGLEQLRKHVDTLLVIPNQKLMEMEDRKLTLQEAFLLADQTLIQGVKGISDIILRAGLINVDFADVRAVMSNAGLATMGLGYADGADAAKRAAKAAVHSPLIEGDLSGANRLLVNVTAGPNFSLGDIQDVMDYILQIADAENAAIYLGHVEDPEAGDAVTVTLVATGFSGTGERPKDAEVFQAEATRERRRAVTLDGEPVAPQPVVQEIDIDIPSILRGRQDRRS